MAVTGAFLRTADVTPPTTFDEWVADANEELAAKADLSGSIFSGDVTVQGAFTSLGIDDNATAERLQIGDGGLVIGAAATDYVMRHAADDRVMFLSGGDATLKGGGISLYGSTHATQANDVELRSGSTVRAFWDNSALQWDFQGNGLFEVSAVQRGIDNGILFLGGDAISTAGANIILFGSNHATDPNRIEFRQGAADRLVYDGTQWDFQNFAVLGINTLELQGNRGIRVDINTGELTISGANGKAVGANLILYGSGHATQASDHEYRTGGTVRKRWDQSVALWDYLNHDVGGVKALTTDMLAFGAAQLLTIAVGVIDATDLSNIRVATEASAATDDLDTINGAVDGQILIIRASDGADTVVCKDGIGNLDLEAGDFSLDTLRDQIILRFEAALSVWLEISRSNNA